MALRPPAPEPIAARTARGAARAFWQALLAGDGRALLCCLSEAEGGLGANSVFDTSDSEEWRQYRSSSRQLSAPGAVPDRSGFCGPVVVVGGWEPLAWRRKRDRQLHAAAPGAVLALLPLRRRGRRSPAGRLGFPCLRQLIPRLFSPRRIVVLTYEQELTTPLHITASRGYLDCLRHLLLRGAQVDLAPGGQTALHAACAAATADCVRLLLAFGADPGAVSEGGFQPLHLCRSPGSSQCARLLLSHGAPVNGASEEEGDTPLHVAARLGLAEQVRLLLQHGADLEARNAEGETPLIAACTLAHSAQAAEAHYDVCRQLLEAGARVNAADRDLQRPLHQACKNANARVVALLLARGANVNIMSYSGNTALHNALQGAPYRLEHRPELAVRHLLNHGAVRVWPGALLKVLRYCCASPRTVEALLNCYVRVPVTEAWQQAVPEELVQRHPSFFRSLFGLGRAPRSLQHLARCALRTCLEGRLLQALPHLRLPPALEQFVLLRFEDLLY